MTHSTPSTPTPSSLALSSELRLHLQEIEDRIARACARASRNRSEVKLCAVTKSVPVERIQSAIDLGLRVFGENRIQEAAQKLSQIQSRADVQWHFIGHLQSNKARRAIELFDTIQTVDSWSLAERLDRIAKELDRTVNVMLEVNLGGESTKTGLKAEEVDELTDRISHLSNLNLKGLMTVPPFLEPVEQVRPYFSRMRELRDLARKRYPNLEDLSMGMTHDFEIAIEEGATIIRVGTALFGPRNN